MEHDVFSELSCLRCSAWRRAASGTAVALGTRGNESFFRRRHSARWHVAVRAESCFRSCAGAAEHIALSAGSYAPKHAEPKCWISGANASKAYGMIRDPRPCGFPFCWLIAPGSGAQALQVTGSWARRACSDLGQRRCLSHLDQNLLHRVFSPGVGDVVAVGDAFRRRDEYDTARFQRLIHVLGD